MHELSTFDFQVNEICRQRGWSFLQTLQRLHEAGYTRLDADINTLTPENQRIIDESGIAVDLIYVAPKALQDCPEDMILERCRRARTDFLMMIPPEDPADWEGTIRKNVSAMNHLAAELAKLGVTPVMEDFDSHEKSYSTPQGLRHYMDQVHGLKCCFDTGNFHYVGADVFETYAAFKNDVVHVHLKDLVPGEPFGRGCEHQGSGIFSGAPTGDGVLGLDRFIATLIRDGYQGNFALEHAPMKDQLAVSLRSAERVREILKEVFI